MPGTSSEQEVTLTIISPLDEAWHTHTVQKLAKMPHFWDDQMRANPAAMYIATFMSPENLTLDVNGDGVMAFHRWGSGMRAILFGVSWGRKAMRIPTARYKAGELALVLLRVQRIEALTREDNTMSRRSMENGGMRYAGRLPGGLWYNGKATNGVWYELDREIDYDLDPL